MKALGIILLVVAMLVGGILTLRSSRNSGMPDAAVLDRAKQRERAQAAKDQDESHD